jgi:hypothetical protein
MGSSTLHKLQKQGDCLQNAERNLDLTDIANKEGAQKLKGLKQANRIVSKPFTAAKRAVDAGRDMLAERRAAREKSDRICAAAWQSFRESNVHKNPDIPRHHGATANDVLVRAMCQFEPDFEDEELDNVIEGNLDELAKVNKKLKGIAFAQGEEIQAHNGRLDRMKCTADKVDDDRARLPIS